MSSDDDPIDPVIDRLWYFDSVVSPNNCKSNTCKANTSPSFSSPKQSSSSRLSRETSLPLSTGGLSFNDSSFRTDSLTEEAEYSPSSLDPSTVEDEDPQMQEVPKAFAAMNDNHDGKLSRDDLYPWMKTLGLQYTTDGMIQLKPSQSDWSGSGNLESTFLLNELLDKESKGALDEEAIYKKSESATKGDVFRQCSRDCDGLISPDELKQALANLGLLKSEKDLDNLKHD